MFIYKILESYIHQYIPPFLISHLVGNGNTTTRVDHFLYCVLRNNIGQMQAFYSNSVFTSCFDLNDNKRFVGPLRLHVVSSSDLRVEHSYIPQRLTSHRCNNTQSFSRSRQCVIQLQPSPPSLHPFTALKKAPLSTEAANFFQAPGFTPLLRCCHSGLHFFWAHHVFFSLHCLSLTT